jgi:hypothetical protein
MGVRVEVIGDMVDGVRKVLDPLSSKAPGIHPDDGHTILMYESEDEDMLLRTARAQSGVTTAVTAT